MSIHIDDILYRNKIITQNHTSNVLEVYHKKMEELFMQSILNLMKALKNRQDNSKGYYEMQIMSKLYDEIYNHIEERYLYKHNAKKLDFFVELLDIIDKTDKIILNSGCLEHGIPVNFTLRQGVKLDRHIYVDADKLLKHIKQVEGKSDELVEKNNKLTGKSEALERKVIEQCSELDRLRAENKYLISKLKVADEPQKTQGSLRPNYKKDVCSADIYKDWTSGMSKKDIAEKYGISRPTVDARLKTFQSINVTIK